MNEKEIAVLIGTLLGDSSLILDRDCINPYFKCCHGPNQKEYCEYKNNNLKSLNSVFKHHVRKKPDKRTGKYYESYIIESRIKEYLKPYYDLFYKDKIKVINPRIFELFTEESLAYLFMDDGYKTTHSIIICTDSFSKEDLLLFVDFLNSKFDLPFNIIGRNRLYLPAKNYTKFKELILPFIHSTMMYKFPK